MKINKVKNSLFKTIVYIILIVFAISVLIPVSWVVMASFKENSEFYGNPWALPKGLYIQNFKDAWTTAKMGSYMFNTIFVTVLAILILLVIALPAAYVLSRYRFKFRGFFRVLFMAGLFINVNYIVVPIFLMLLGAERTFGVSGLFLNNIFVLAIVYAATALPFTIYLLSSYFATLPKDFEEAAYIDGAGYYKTMVRVMFPMARPSIITVILFNFLSFWNEYIISMTLLTDPRGKKTLAVGLLNLMKAQNAAARYGEMYAGLTIVMIPTLLMYMLVQKKLTEGMTIGGIKG